MPTLMRSSLCKNCVRINIFDLCALDSSRIKTTLDAEGAVDQYVYLQDVHEYSSFPMFLVAENLQALVKSADKGCRMCGFVYQAIAMTKFAPRRTWLSTVSDSEAIYLQAANYLDNQLLQIDMRTDEGAPYPQAVEWPRLSIQPWDIECTTNDNSLPLPSPHTDPLSETLIELGRSWIADCMQNRACHAKCNTRRKVFLPARLVDVGDSADSTWLRLMETDQLSINDIKETSEYLALSYVWGSTSGHTTIVQNFEDREEGGFSCTTLPQTLQDAVLITRKLGYRYLWVDSLCILQDSPEDKSHNIGEMEEIYACAACVITASTARGADEGMFASRDWARYNANSVEISLMPKQTRLAERFRTSNFFGLRTAKIESSSLIPSECQSRSSDYIAQTSCCGWQGINRTPIETRSWCFQERVLASRRLIFGELGLCWECPGLVASEMEPDGNMFPSRSKRHKPLKWNLDSWMYKLNVNGIDELEETVPGGSWRNLVQHYTARKLTEASDRLPALAGIARRWKQTTAAKDDVYLAGLWLNALIWDLCWFWRGVLPDADADAKPWQNGQISLSRPSWSWAAQWFSDITWPIWYTDHQDLLPQTKCLRYELQYESKDRFSTVTGGALYLQGPLGRINPLFLRRKLHRSVHDMEDDSRTVCLTVTTVRDPFILLLARLSPVKERGGEEVGRREMLYALILEWVQEDFRRVGLYTSGVAADFEGYTDAVIRLA